MSDLFQSLVLLPSPPAFLLLWVLFSFCVGSFLSVVGFRLPKILDALEAGQEPEMSLSFPASQCPTCKTPLTLRDNLPLLGWLLNAGRCRHCKAPISPSYLILELAAGAWGAWCAWKHQTPLHIMAWSAFGWYLLACAWIDAQSQWLPDVLSLGLLWGGLLFAASGFGPVSPAVAIGSAAGVWVALTAISRAYTAWRQTVGLAGGDIKLLCAVAAWSGLYWGTIVVTVAFGLLVLYALTTRNRSTIPLGPCIAVAAVICHLWLSRY